MEIHIRPMKIEDAEEVARLSDELGYPSNAKEIAERMEHLARSMNHFLIVTEGEAENLLGWIGVERRLLLESGKKFEIVGLVVDSRQRGRGIGKSLVAAAEEWIVANGGDSVFVRSNITRQESHPFYRGLGYDHSKTQHAYAKKLHME